jgi:phospholipid/cholesterol/gamma-HCH transport system substrate-binding protein
MISARTWLNLASFFLISFALVAYGYFELLGNPLAKSITISAVFPNASGVSPNFSVVLDGVDVGSVSSVALVPHGAKIVMSIEPGTYVPANVRASISIANDLGQQEIELTPKGTASTHPIADGAVVPIVPGGVPTDVGTVVQTFSDLLRSIPVDKLNTVLHEAAVGFAGRAPAVDTFISASKQFSSEFIAYEDQFKALLANSPPVLDTLTSVGPQLRSALRETAVLAGVMATHRYALVRLLNEGVSAASVADELVTAEDPNLACMLHDGADINSNLAQPPVLGALNQGLLTNQWFFNAVVGATPTGPAKSLYPGDPASSNQEWLRTRLYLPPKSPSASQYSSPTSLPPVLPGAGCSTQFGNGVGPASQSTSLRPVSGARVVAPSRADSRVGGGR